MLQPPRVSCDKKLLSHLYPPLHLSLSKDGSIFAMTHQCFFVGFFFKSLGPMSYVLCPMSLKGLVIFWMIASSLLYILIKGGSIQHCTHLTLGIKKKVSIPIQSISTNYYIRKCTSELALNGTQLITLQSRKQKLEPEWQSIGLVLLSF